MKTVEKKALDEILSAYESLYDAEKRVADYVINNQQQIIYMTVAELSAASGASEATIVRFCKKCDFKGFHHLKMQMAKGMLDNEVKDISNDLDIHNIPQSIQNILSNKVEEMKETLSRIDADELKIILELIKSSKTVLFAAVGNTIPVALDGAYKFNQIGIASIANPIWETQIAFTYNLTEKDTVIAISDSGSSKRILTLVDAAKEKGASTICITNHVKSPLANATDFQIYTANREKLFFSEFKFTRIPAMIVIETLFLLLTAEKRDAYDHINEHEQSIADERV